MKKTKWARYIFKNINILWKRTSNKWKQNETNWTYFFCFPPGHNQTRKLIRSHTRSLKHGPGGAVQRGAIKSFLPSARFAGSLCLIRWQAARVSIQFTSPPPPPLTLHSPRVFYCARIDSSSSSSSSLRSWSDPSCIRTTCTFDASSALSRSQKFGHECFFFTRERVICYLLFQGWDLLYVCQGCTRFLNLIRFLICVRANEWAGSFWINFFRMKNRERDKKSCKCYDLISLFFKNDIHIVF